MPWTFALPCLEPQGLGCPANIPWVLLVLPKLPLESVSEQLTKYTGITEQLKFVCVSFRKKKKVCIFESTSPLPKNSWGTSVLVLSRALEGGSTAATATFSIFTGKSKHYTWLYQLTGALGTAEKQNPAASNWLLLVKKTLHRQLKTKCPTICYRLGGILWVYWEHSCRNKKPWSI